MSFDFAALTISQEMVAVTKVKAVHAGSSLPWFSLELKPSIGSSCFDVLSLLPLLLLPVATAEH